MARVCVLWLLIIALFAALAATRPCGASRLLRTGNLVPSGGPGSVAGDELHEEDHGKHEYSNTSANIDDSEEFEDLDSCFESISQQSDSPGRRETRCSRMLRDYDEAGRHRNFKRINS